MVDRPFIVDPATLDLSQVEADQETIRRYNPQRFEMEQLSAICLSDTEQNICVGYKDVTENEFWVRGHMPGRPLMPGVVMCEVAAQITSYYVMRHLVQPGTVIGLAGVEGARFRGMVCPGDRLVIVAKLTKYRPGLLFIFPFQGFVKSRLVCEGEIRGVVLPDQPTATQS